MFQLAGSTRLDPVGKKIQLHGCRTLSLILSRNTFGNRGEDGISLASMIKAHLLERTESTSSSLNTHANEGVIIAEIGGEEVDMQFNFKSRVRFLLDRQLKRKSFLRI
jgi:hypothetical protein